MDRCAEVANNDLAEMDPTSLISPENKGRYEEIRDALLDNARSDEGLVVIIDNPARKGDPLLCGESGSHEKRQCNDCQLFQKGFFHIGLFVNYVV